MAALDARLVGVVSSSNHRPYKKEGWNYSIISFVASGRLYVGSAAQLDDVQGVEPGVDFVDVVDLNVARFRSDGQKDELFDGIVKLQRGSEVSVWLSLETVYTNGRLSFRIGQASSVTVLARPDALLSAARPAFVQA